jgi:peptidoglycan/LPS O-acetylase OafA/YrhL
MAPLPNSASPKADRSARHAYASLDGLRGVAALAVVLYHYASDLIAPHGYLAVDLFFAMSGFVIASAYEAKLQSGLDLRGFLGIRARRLAPLWMLGAIVGFVLTAGWMPGPTPLPVLVILAACALLLVPHATTLVGAFPLNTSLWSLHVELVVNLAYARFAQRLTTRRMLVLAGCSYLALTAIALSVGALSHGTSPLDLLVGYLRALVCFPLGVVLWRVRERLPHIRFGAAGLLAVTALLLTGFGLAPHSLAGVLYDLAFVGLVVPMLVVTAVRNEPSARLRPFFASLGGWSYAIYALHQPIIFAVRRYAADHGGLPTYLMLGAPLVASLILIAWAADRLYDAPVRRWLGRVRGRTAAAQAEAAA